MGSITKLIINLVLGALACWAFVEMYDTYSQVSKIFENGLENGFEFTMNLTPLAIVVLALIFYVIILLKKEGSLARMFSLIPYEFEEQDEREKMLTARACRKAYIAMTIAVPFAGALLCLYPFVQQHIPYFPIIVIFLLFAVMQITYTVTYRKQLK